MANSTTLREILEETNGYAGSAAPTSQVTASKCCSWVESYSPSTR
jgi:hypothetical protein